MEYVPIDEFKKLQEELEMVKQLLSEKIIPKKRLLTQVEAREYLNRSAGTINTLVKMGEIKQVKEPSVDGKSPRPKYDIRDLDAYIQKHKDKEMKSYKPNK